MNEAHQPSAPATIRKMAKTHGVRGATSSSMSGGVAVWEAVTR